MKLKKRYLILILILFFRNIIYCYTVEQIIKNVNKRREEIKTYTAKFIEKSLLNNKIRIEHYMIEHHKNGFQKVRIEYIYPDFSSGCITILNKEKKFKLRYYPPPISEMYLDDNYETKSNLPKEVFNYMEIFKGIKYKKSPNEKLFGINMITLEGVPESENDPRKYTKLWIDPNTWLMRQMKMTQDQKIIGKKGIITSIISTPEIKINPDIPDSMFEFTPPPGTKILPFPEKP